MLCMQSHSTHAYTCCAFALPQCEHCRVRRYLPRPFRDNTINWWGQHPKTAFNVGPCHAHPNDIADFEVIFCLCTEVVPSHAQKSTFSVCAGETFQNGKGNQILFQPPFHLACSLTLNLHDCSSKFKLVTRTTALKMNVHFGCDL